MRQKIGWWMLLPVLAAVGAVTCLDVAVTTTKASEACVCQTVAVHGTIGPEGEAWLELPTTVQDLPVLSVYQRVNGWSPADFTVLHGRTVVVYGEPGTDVRVVAVRSANP